MSNGNVRVKIPENVEQLLQLAAAIYQKHQSDATGSLLNALEDYKWDDLGPSVSPALAKHLEAEKLRMQMEKALILMRR